MKTNTSNTRQRAALFSIALLGTFFLSGCNVRDVPYDAKVLDKVYTPSSSSTGVGYGQTFNGKGGIVVTTTHQSEKYTLIVQRKDNHETTSVRVDAATWASAEKGSTITLTETLLF